jgi:hypothetical protein
MGNIVLYGFFYVCAKFMEILLFNIIFFNPFLGIAKI